MIHMYVCMIHIETSVAILAQAILAQVRNALLNCNFLPVCGGAWRRR